MFKYLKVLSLKNSRNLFVSLKKTIKSIQKSILLFKIFNCCRLQRRLPKCFFTISMYYKVKNLNVTHGYRFEFT